MNSQKDDANDSDTIPEQILHISTLSSNTITSTPTKNDYSDNELYEDIKKIIAYLQF